MTAAPLWRLHWASAVIMLLTLGYTAARASPPPHHRPSAVTQRLLSQIQRDLSPWEASGITLDMVERSYCTDFEKSFRFQVVNGEMFIAGEFEGFMEFNKMAKLWILDVAKHYKLPDVDVILTTSDGCPPVAGFQGNWTKCQREIYDEHAPAWLHAPLFAYDRRDDEHHCVRYPDHTMYSWPTAGLPSWADVRAMMDMNEPVPYRDKINTMLFRGAQTGNRMVLSGDDDFIWNPLTDFRITGWTGETAAGQWVTLPAHCLHKYLLHLPGMAYSARIKYLMYCNSTVIFAGMDQKEFWYHLLEDGKNVVMVPSISEDTKGGAIIQALEGLAADQDRAERIAMNGYELVSKVLNPETVRRYFYELLVAYSKLQRFKPTRHPQAIPFKYSALGPDSVNTLGTRECGYCAWQPTAGERATAEQ